MSRSGGDYLVVCKCGMYRTGCWFSRRAADQFGHSRVIKTDEVPQALGLRAASETAVEAVGRRVEAAFAGKLALAVFDDGVVEGGVGAVHEM